MGKFSLEYIEKCRKLPPRKKYHEGDWCRTKYDPLCHERKCELNYLTYGNGFNNEEIVLVTELGFRNFPTDDVIWLPHTVQQWMEIFRNHTDIGRVEISIGDPYYFWARVPYGKGENIVSKSTTTDLLMACALAYEKTQEVKL